MRLNLESGDVVSEIILSLDMGVQKMTLPEELEVLHVGLREKNAVIYYLKRGSILKEKSFVVYPSYAALPDLKFKYYWYIGTVSKKGLHIFEII